jgi:hypothetical protein
VLLITNPLILVLFGWIVKEGFSISRPTASSGITIVFCKVAFLVFIPTHINYRINILIKDWFNVMGSVTWMVVNLFSCCVQPFYSRRFRLCQTDHLVEVVRMATSHEDVGNENVAHIVNSLFILTGFFLVFVGPRLSSLVLLLFGLPIVPWSVEMFGTKNKVEILFFSNYYLIFFLGEENGRSVDTPTDQLL